MSQTELNASIMRIGNYVHCTPFGKLIYMYMIKRFNIFGHRKEIWKVTTT